MSALIPRRVPSPEHSSPRSVTSHVAVAGDAGGHGEEGGGCEGEGEGEIASITMSFLRVGWACFCEYSLVAMTSILGSMASRPSTNVQQSVG